VDGAEEILARAQAGDREAFRDLYLAHHASLYRYALAETGRAEDAKDIVQDTFVRAWEALPRFRGESSLLHWLYRIARNQIIDRARKRKRRGEVSLDAPLDDSGETRGDRAASPRRGPDEEAESAEDLARFRAALAALPEAQRSVFVLREWDGLPYDQIAARLGLNEGTVKSRLARAREALLDRLRQDRDA
jgi:RNA polymerase sigma factor (sigma-70 family)